MIELLDRIADSGRGTTANRVLAAVRKLFNWTLERDIIPASPCAGVKPPAAETSRDRILSDDEIRWLWQACDGAGYPFGPLVKLLLVTAQREEEVGKAVYGELALSADPPSWTIPAARAKNGREQYVPLSRRSLCRSSRACHALPDARDTCSRRPARHLCRAFPEPRNGLIGKCSPWPAQRPWSAVTIPPRCSIPHWTLHDLRRTAASGMARLAQPVHVVEAVLNHKSGTIRGVAAVYNRYAYGPEKQAALETWARALESITTGVPASNVVALRG